MRDQVIIQEFQRINALLNALAQHVQLSLSGGVLFDEALKNLLLKKGVITEIELKEQIGEEIKKANEAPAPEPVEEKPTDTLITPSAAEVAKVEETKLL